MPPGHFWGLVGVFVMLGAAAFIGAFVLLTRARTMENTPTALIRSAAQGFVELEGQGRLMEGPSVVAPLTGGHCCWWHYKVEKRRREKNSTYWDTVDSGTSDDCFLLTDATGECVIDPHGASVVPASSDVWYGSTRRPSIGPKAGGGWLRRLGGEYRYTEERLEINGPLYAIGAFRTQGGGEIARDVNDGDVRALLAKWKTDPKMRQLLDVNRDGQIDQQEWEAARVMARNKVMQESAAEPPPPDVNLLNKPVDGRPFVLSAVPQAKLILRYKLQSALFLGLSIGAGVATVMFLQARHVL